MTDPDRRSLAVNEEPLPPERYPWQPIDRPGVLAERRFIQTGEIDSVLQTLGAKLMPNLHRVLAVGSNASFDVMHRKMARVGLETPLAMTIMSHTGVAVGHSAHVSLPGYVAAAPYRCAGYVRRFVAVHVDDEQLAPLDPTEPNCARIEHEGTWIYASHWEVLAVRGIPVSSHRRPASTRSSVPPTPVGEIGSGAPWEPRSRLQSAHDGTVSEWRHHWRSTGLIRHAGSLYPAAEGSAQPASTSSPTSVTSPSLMYSQTPASRYRA